MSFLGEKGECPLGAERGRQRVHGRHRIDELTSAGSPRQERHRVQRVAVVAGLLLLAGLWTPIAGSLGAAISIWFALNLVEDPLAGILLATMGAGLALVGPGAWSADAKLFGWKRIDVGDRSK